MSLPGLKGRLRTFIRRTAWVLAAAAVPLLFVCCSAGWLPDSSGFLFAQPGGVYLYDVKTETSRRVVERKLGPPPFHVLANPAVWPTGDRFVFATTSKEDNASTKTTVRLQFVKLDGESAGEPRTYVIDEGDKKPQFSPPVALSYVSPDKRHVIVFLFGVNAAVIYNVETAQFHHVQNVAPLTMFPLVEHAFTMESPIASDGSGFVAVREQPGKSPAASMVFVGWDGGEPREFEKGDELLSNGGAAKSNENGAGTKPAKVATIWRWEKNTLTTTREIGRIEIDPKEMKVQVVKDERFNRLIAHAEMHKVTVLAEFPNGTILHRKDDGAVELWRPDAEPVLVKLLDGNATDVALTMSVSPNRRYVYFSAVAPAQEHKLLDTESGAIKTVRAN